jgi:hypothetical protein
MERSFFALSRAHFIMIGMTPIWSLEAKTRPDLLWDNETRGLCVRVYGDGSRSFIFVCRISDRQHGLRFRHSWRSVTLILGTINSACAIYRKVASATYRQPQFISHLLMLRVDATIERDQADRL